jgi:hypothetical protein
VTTLAAKLGVTPASRVLVVGPVPPDVLDELFAPHRRAGAEPYDVIVAFCPDHSTLMRHLERCPPRLTTTGGLWLTWQKRSSGVTTDTGEADVRGAGLASGLVDNKIASINEAWSGLRFVRRVRDR